MSRLFIISFFLVIISGCNTNSSFDALTPSDWLVGSYVDPLNDSKVCRIAGHPDFEDRYFHKGTYYSIAPYIEKINNTIVIGFFSHIGNSMLGTLPLVSAEFRFDENPPFVIKDALPSPSIVIDYFDQASFLKQITSSKVMKYRVNNNSVIELDLSDFNEVAKTCDLDSEGIQKAAKEKIYLGINYDTQILKIPGYPEGAIILRVLPNSPAAKAQINLGDIVTAVNGLPVRNKLEFETAMGEYGPGDTIVLDVTRLGQNKKIEFIAALLRFVE